MKLAFLWHWRKKLDSSESQLAIKDSIVNAIGKLNNEYKSFVFILDDKGEDRDTYSEEHNINYIFRNDLAKIKSEITKLEPDLLMFNHNSRDYSELVFNLSSVVKLKGVYITSSIESSSIWKEFDFIFANHNYQKDLLVKYGADPKNVWISPKTADEEIFYPDPTIEKKWDVVYPARGPIGYFKRPEIAIEACRRLGLKIVLPGADINENDYDHVTVLGWLTQEKLAQVYNQARCLVITSDYREQGPRVIPEAVMCNLPFVVCKDSPAGVSYAEKLNGYAAKPNPRSVAKAIKKALESNFDYRKKAIELGLDIDGNYRLLKEVIFRYQRGIK